MVVGLLGAGLFLGAGTLVSVTVKRRFFAAWRGSLAVIGVALVWVCWALALGQLLGAVGLLRRGALLAAALLSAAATAATLGRSGTPTTAEDRPAPAAGKSWQDQALTAGTVLLVLVVAAIWIARTVIALHRGINDPDSLGYHLPFMVTFAQSGYADQHRLVLPLYPIQFFPADDELLGAMALAITRSLAFAAVKNLLFGGLLLAAAHALGKAFGAARLATAAAAIALGFPVVAFFQPGEGVNDALLLLVLVGGLAALAHARDRPAPYVLALACAGIALGVKFSAIVPAAGLGALAVVLLLARVPAHRWRWTGIGLLASAAMGASWYVRNAVTYGNPVPPVHIGNLPTVTGPAYELANSVAHYVVRGQFLGVFARGAVRGLGPLVVVAAAVWIFGGVAGLRSQAGLSRGLSCLALLALAGYLVTPAGAYGTAQQVAGSYVINLHYAIPALLVGMLAGAIALARRRSAWILPVVGVAAVATSIGRGRGIAVWSPELGGAGFGLLLAAAVVGTTVSVTWWSRPSVRRMAAAASLALAVAAVTIIAGRYPSRRTTDPLVGWAATVPHARIAAWIANFADLYGPQGQNRVVILSRPGGGGAVPLDTCQGWKQAVHDGHFEYTAVMKDTAWPRWLRADPAFQVVADELAGATINDVAHLRRYRTVVFKVVGPPDVSCPGQSNADAAFWLAPVP